MRNYLVQGTMTDEEVKVSDYMFASGDADPLKSTEDDRRLRVLNPLELSIEKGRKLGRTALYFGCWRSAGHYLHDLRGSHIYGDKKLVDLHWNLGLMDTGLLKNGKVKDEVTGRVFWTCGGEDAFWYAFYWWDRSVDRRGGSNSGFYVRGFGWPEAQAAFDYACGQFPTVAGRQALPLVLQDVTENQQNYGADGSGGW